jgi:ubiquinone/menaquinone biosynthesis C-methylase UbiE
LKETRLGYKEKRDVMHRYDVTSEMYEERYAQEQKAKYEKALGAARLGEGMAVLDVGCGSGLFFSHVADQVNCVVGVDISCKLLQKANSQAKAWQNVFVVQADADHLPFKNEFFGAVFSFTVLQNMPTPAETMCELKRVAKVGGSVVVTGLKKYFGLCGFMDVLEGSGLLVSAFFDEDGLNCYVAACTR